MILKELQAMKGKLEEIKNVKPVVQVQQIQQIHQIEPQKSSVSSQKFQSPARERVKVEDVAPQGPETQPIDESIKSAELNQPAKHF